ncbi:MAG: GxxExxY protein, partial [Candidatus Sumerlaeota bacterium]|nr:GxxExxY protein [Candidatus Sumerlaeota bacterium]
MILPAENAKKRIAIAMPIHVANEIRCYTEDEFREFDHILMGIIFETHNEFGRFLNEDLYSREIAARCLEEGIAPAECQTPIKVTHDSFEKIYRMDLLLAHGLMVEMKTAETLTPAHRSQALNYMCLTGMHHGRLINLRPELVQHEVVSTSLTHEARREFTVVDREWLNLNAESAQLKTITLDLLKDWGAFLEFTLYRDAVTYFLGGLEAIYRNVEIFSGNRLLGEQHMHLLTSDTAFAFSAKTEETWKMKEHQRRFLRHTHLKYIQWINLNHHQIEFTTLKKSS